MLGSEAQSLSEQPLSIDDALQGVDGLTATQALRREWRVIRKEYEGLRDSCFVPSSGPHLYRPGGWEVAHLFRFGQPINEVIDACPITAGLVSLFPNLLNARFSLLRPQTVIRRHHGAQVHDKPMVRLHLGLIVPGDCGMTIGDEICLWAEGECFAFDDSVEHDAWNRSVLSRVILIVDYLANRQEAYS